MSHCLSRGTGSGWEEMEGDEGMKMKWLKVREECGYKVKEGSRAERKGKKRVLPCILCLGDAGTV